MRSHPPRSLIFFLIASGVFCIGYGVENRPSPEARQIALSRHPAKTAVSLEAVEPLSLSPGPLIPLGP